MTLTDHAAASGDERSDLTPRTLPWWGFGVANTAVVFLLAIGFWWLLVDPEWSLLGIYPQPFNAVLFWTIIASVWVGFTFEWLGPPSIGQPWRGLVGIGLTLAIGIAVTALVAYGWGVVDPSFAAARDGGAGYTAAQMFVLFAFFFYVLSAVNAEHWPWSAVTRQPWTGFGELTLMFVPTLVVYLVLALPGQVEWAPSAAVLLSSPTLIGWFYSLIVSVIVTGLLAENLPWTLAGSRAGTAVAGLLGNIVLGTALYFVMLGAARVLMGSDNVTATGDGVTAHAAQLGVCWVFWMVAWANAFGNKPTGLSRGINITVRIAVTAVLGVATYLLYYFVLAQHILHEPVAGGTLFGDALGFVDWLILWTLWYVLFLGSFGLPRNRSDAATA